MQGGTQTILICTQSTGTLTGSPQHWEPVEEPRRGHASRWNVLECARDASRKENIAESTDVQALFFKVRKCCVWKLSALFSIISNVNLNSAFTP